MSCGEPIDYSKPWFAPAGLNRGKVEPTYTLYGTTEEMKQQLEFQEQLEWAHTPLDELPKLSDMEYFQRNMLKGLAIPESYIVNGIAPASKDDMVSRTYLDGTIAETQEDVIVIDTMEEFVSYFGQPGNLYLDTTEGDDLDTMGKLFSYDGAKWVDRVAEFDFFDISLVREPLLDECKLSVTFTFGESDEDKYDRAMVGVEQ